MTPRYPWIRVRTWEVAMGAITSRCSRCRTKIPQGGLMTTWVQNPGEAERVVHVCAACDDRALALVR